MSAAEFALLLPVMLLIVCGIMDFGNLYYQINVVNEAAREAARYAATYKTSGGNPPNQTTVQSYLTPIYPNVTIEYFNPASPTSGNPVTVRVSQAVRIMTPVINRLIPNNPTTVKGSCVMQVE